MKVIALNTKGIEYNVARSEMYAARERCQNRDVGNIALTLPNRKGLYCAIFLVDAHAEEFLQSMKRSGTPYVVADLGLLGVSPEQPIRRIAQFIQDYFAV